MTPSRRSSYLGALRQTGQGCHTHFSCAAHRPREAGTHRMSLEFSSSWTASVGSSVRDGCKSMEKVTVSLRSGMDASSSTSGGSATSPAAAAAAMATPGRPSTPGRGLSRGRRRGDVECVATQLCWIRLLSASLESSSLWRAHAASQPPRGRGERSQQRSAAGCSPPPRCVLRPQSVRGALSRHKAVDEQLGGARCPPARPQKPPSTTIPLASRGALTWCARTCAPSPPWSGSARGQTCWRCR